MLVLDVLLKLSFYVSACFYCFTSSYKQINGWLIEVVAAAADTTNLWLNTIHVAWVFHQCVYAAFHCTPWVKKDWAKIIFFC